MKTILLIISSVLMILAGLATPIGIVEGVYRWAAEDLEFKYALWEGVKTWLLMLSCIIVGYPMFLATK